MKKSSLLLLVLVIALFTLACKKESREKPPVKDCIDKALVNPKANCDDKKAPVCGCDGVTYYNACKAKASGVTSWREGECTKKEETRECINKSLINPKANCDDKKAPVCGCDGVTYYNACKAKASGVTSWKEGECPKKEGNKDCIDKSLINPKAKCDDKKAPVCGCDGVTYYNACKAKASGVTSWKEGECRIK